MNQEAPLTPSGQLAVGAAGLGYRRRGKAARLVTGRRERVVHLQSVERSRYVLHIGAIMSCAFVFTIGQLLWRVEGKAARGVPK